MEADAVILNEARRLYTLGFGVHWIKKGEKAPVKGGWSGPIRDDWKTLKKEYKSGYGLGVRMGQASKITLEDGTSGYLANIDIDIKSGENRHRKEAKKALFKVLPELKKLGRIPTIKTGYGLRYVILTEKPITSFNIARSKEEAIVLMPTAEINKNQLKALADKIITQKQLDAGYRVRAAWEVDFMSTGKQVVLPPSIHPETKKQYAWIPDTNIESVKDLPLIHSSAFKSFSSEKAKSGSDTHAFKEFTVTEVDIVSSDLPDEWVDKILSGEGVTNRSDECFSVAMVMLRAGYSEDEIISVLTDRRNYLGDTGYDHANTKNRQRAGKWIRKYCLARALKETDLTKDFEILPSDTPLHDSDEKATKALKKSSLKEHGDNWHFSIEHRPVKKDGTPGGIVPSMKNIILILTHDVDPKLFKFDLFNNAVIYGATAPWVKATKHKLVEDADVVLIVEWLAVKWHFEPTKVKVEDAISAIASRNSFHPVRSLLRKLPDWDGVDRLDTWMVKYFGAKGGKAAAEYHAQVFRKWLVASVTRTFEPGTKFDWMILLEGEQGSGKSSFGSILFGEKYFADWLPDLSNKDAALGLAGTRCIEFGELDRVKRSDIEATKAFITRTTDKVRPHFGKRNVELPRQVVFFGTTNKERYFQDESGNRRFNPVEVGQLDFEALKRDSDMLWAEALFIYDNCLEESLYLEGEALIYSKEKQSEKMIEDESVYMVPILSKFITNELAKKPEERFSLARFSLVDLMDRHLGPLNNFPQTVANLQKVAKAVKVLGGIKHKTAKANYWDFGIDLTKYG